MTDTPEYTPPNVWSWNKPSGGRFANINRPIATSDSEYPDETGLGRPPPYTFTSEIEEISPDP